jgi:hypothetical protein
MIIAYDVSSVKIGLIFDKFWDYCNAYYYMISISSLILEKISATPLIANMLSKNLLNTNQYAREIQSELEKKLGKTITLNSIVVAISRCKDKIKSPSKISVKKISVAYPVFWNYYKFKSNHDLIDFLGDQSVHKDDLFSFKNNKLIIINKKQTKKDLEHVNEDILNQKMSNFCEIKVECNEDQVNQSGLFYVISSCLYWADISIIDINIIRDKLYIYVKNDNVSHILDILRENLLEVE